MSFNCRQTMSVHLAQMVSPDMARRPGFGAGPEAEGVVTEVRRLRSRGRLQVAPETRWRGSDGAAGGHRCGRAVVLPDFWSPHACHIALRAGRGRREAGESHPRPASTSRRSASSWGIFGFAQGGITRSSRGVDEAGGIFADVNVPQLFYSQKIGLEEGRIVPVVVARLNGKVGPFDAGR